MLKKIMKALKLLTHMNNVIEKINFMNIKRNMKMKKN